jgi:hypothetical protein
MVVKVYAAWYEGENNVLFSHSTDGGISFSSPIQPLGEGRCTESSGYPPAIRVTTSGPNVYIASQREQIFLKGTLLPKIRSMS